MNNATDKWYVDWQAAKHVTHFDFRSSFSSKDLIRNYETYNDVQLLNARLREGNRSISLLEVGCATGEFSRYLRLKWPQVTYCGSDISQPAIDRARTKYPAVQFLTSTPSDTGDFVNVLGLDGNPDFLYSKDVVHHQVDPFAFMQRLIDTMKHTLVMRLRTRDAGATVLDPEVSCQYHYDGWMPYIVMNVDEIVEHVRAAKPKAELVIHRHHIVLGGLNNRFLPKECYLTETGTAETAVGVFLRTNYPGRVTVEDRPESDPAYTARHLWSSVLRRARSVLMQQRR